MDSRPRAQSVLQVRSQSRGPELDRPRTTTLFSSLKGYIRFPNRKSKDDRDANHPYMQRGSSDAGLKPYMSQPMLGLASSHKGRYPQADRDVEDSSERSTSTDHSPARLTRSGEIPRPLPKPHAVQKQKAPPVNNGVPPTSTAFTNRGASIDGLPVESRQAHSAFSNNNVATQAIPHRPLNRKPEISTSLRDTVYITQKQLPPDPSNSLQHSIPPIPDQRSSSSKPPIPARSAADSSISAQMNSDTGVDNATTPKSAFTTPTLLQRTAINNTSMHPRRQGVPTPRLTMPSPSQKFSLQMNDGSSGSARLSPSVVLRTPLRLQLPTLPPVTPTTPSAVPRSHRKQLESMPALPLQGTGRGTQGQEEADDGEEDDEDEDDETAEAEVEEPRSSIDSEASQSGSVNDSASRQSGHRPGSRASSYYTPGEFYLPSKDAEASTSRKPQLPEVDTSRIDLSFLDRSVLSGPIQGKGKAKEEYHMLRTPIAAPIRPSPSINTNVSTTDYFTSRIPAAGDRTPHQWPSYGSASATKTPKPGDSAFRMPLPSPRVTAGELPMHPKMYKRASRSLMDVSAMLKEINVDMILEEGAREEDLKGKRASRRFKEGDLGASPVIAPRTPKVDAGESATEQQRQKRISAAPAYEIAVGQQLKRRRSMPTFTESSDPPPYPAFPPFHGAQRMRITPREDEGKEKLPTYSNAIYLKAIMPRKLEFSAPGVQAKDRKWRRVMCVLEGTAFRIYDCPANVAGISTLSGWWERTVGVGDVSEDNAVVKKESTKEAERRRDREREEERERKAQEAREGRSSVSVVIPSSRSASPAPPVAGSSRQSCEQNSQQPYPLPHAATRSALNLAVNLLKPSKAHGRSNSDVPRSPVRPRSPRPSLNLPRTSPEASSRSHSPAGSSPRSSGLGHSSATSYNSSTMRSASPFNTSPATSSSLRPVARSGQNSARSSMFKEKEDEKEYIPDPNPADLIKQYTLQNAESGLGNDYLKRKNVIRVRMEGEQFLLQAKDVKSVVEWIEGLQAATNIALDLDERPMPRGPLFPRRRRRRRQQAAAATGEGDDAAAPSGGDATTAATTS